MRRSLLLAVIVATAIALPLTADASHRRASAGRATVKVAFNAKLKLKILVDSRGFTLYLWESDRRDRSTCYTGCSDAWLPLTTVGKPIAGPGVKKRLLRTTKRRDGTVQVTYNHHPLYTDAGSAQLGLNADTAPGDINGHGWANWYAVSPSGRAIHKLP
jgi:predicted lipoprotein with Yx(FWY)xxD motif